MHSTHGIAENRPRDNWETRREKLHPIISSPHNLLGTHSWTTIAAEPDIPKETIAAALGHGGNSVTDVYIRFDDRKIDEANRRVLDYVFYDKK